MDLSLVEASKCDIKRKIKLPVALDEKLAELIGIHIGDGNSYKFKDNKNRTIMSYTGDLEDDFVYYREYVEYLYKKLFGIKLSFIKYGNWFMIRLSSLAIFTFFTEVLGLPCGKKANTIRIPRIVLNASNEIKCSLLRGITDTDGSLTFKKKHKNVHYYPIIKIDSASRQLIEDVKNILILLGFKIYTQFDCKEHNIKTKKIYIKHSIYLSGRKNLDLWIKKIGFKNPKHITKYLIWQKFGFCPPKTTLTQRYSILNEKLDPYSFYSPGSSVWTEQ